jgi:hypothetical protein
MLVHRDLRPHMPPSGDGPVRVHCVTYAVHLRYALMVASKTATLNLRIDPALKEALRIAALRDHRSIANLLEVLIRQHCQEHAISIPEQQDLTLGPDDE